MNHVCDSIIMLIEMYLFTCGHSQEGICFIKVIGLFKGLLNSIQG